MKPQATNSFYEDDAPAIESQIEENRPSNARKSHFQTNGDHSRQSTTGRVKLITRKETKKMGKGALFFQALGIIRVIFTSSYSFYLAYQGFLNQTYISMGATPVFVASMVALCLDVVFVVLRACPSLLNKCTPPSKLNAVLSTGVWLLILDQDMVMDLLTPLMNLYLSIYKYRLAELVVLNSTADGLRKEETANIMEKDELKSFLLSFSYRNYTTNHLIQVSCRSSCFKLYLAHGLGRYTCRLD